MRWDLRAENAGHAPPSPASRQTPYHRNPIAAFIVVIIFAPTLLLLTSFLSGASLQDFSLWGSLHSGESATASTAHHEDEYLIGVGKADITG